jgi:DNA-binding NarL/FixJ family response regulator
VSRLAGDPQTAATSSEFAHPTGHTSKEIAAMLVISIKTVDRHRTNMLGKLRMRDRVELTGCAISPETD